MVTLDEPGTFLDVASYGDEAGRIVASGEWGDPSREPGIARFLSDGELDGSFGDGGVVRGLPGPIAVQGDGVVVGGDGVITRLGAGGDVSWTATVDAAVADIEVDDRGLGQGGVLFAGNRVVTLPDGSTRHRAVAGRLSEDGSLEWVTDFELAAEPGVTDPGWDALAVDVSQDSQDNVGVVGYAWQPDSEPFSSLRRFGAVRLSPDGELDPGFGTGGGVSHPVPTPYAAAQSATFDSEDRLVIGGYSSPPAAYLGDSTLMRLSQDGSFDADFNTTDPIGLKTYPGLQMDGNGSVVGAGATAYMELLNMDVGVFRMTRDGTPDAGFGFSGLAQVEDTNMGHYNLTRGLALDSLDPVVAGARGGLPMLARFLGAPREDDAGGGTAGALGVKNRGARIHRLIAPRSLSKLQNEGVRALASCELDCRMVLEVRSGGRLVARGSRLAGAGKRRWVLAKLLPGARRAMATRGSVGRLRARVRGLTP